MHTVLAGAVCSPGKELRVAEGGGEGEADPQAARFSLGL